MRHVSYLAVIALTAFSFLSVSAQQRAYDSVISEINADTVSTKDLELEAQYVQLSNYYLDKNPDSAIYWAEQTLSFALLKNNWKFQQDGLQALKQAEAALTKNNNTQNDLFLNQLSKQNRTITILTLVAIIFFLSAVVVLIFYLRKVNNVKNLEVDSTEHIELIKNLQADLKDAEKRNNELKDQQQQLQTSYTQIVKSNEIKDKLIPMIAHDIRSPLGNLQNSLGLIRDNVISPEEFQKLSLALEGDVFNLRGMLDNMLLWAREQMFEVKINKIHFDLSETFKEIILMYRSSLVNKNITLHNYMPQQLEVMSDKEIINVVVRNLLSNAVKFTEPGKNIYISQIFFNGKIYISIRDEGKGISPETLTRLNNKQHISTRGTANEKGTGLGLLFSSEMLAKLNEAFDITSYPDKGTSVTFSVSMS